jgi:hypothetical protein
MLARAKAAASGHAEPAMPSMPSSSPAAQMLARPDLDLRMPGRVRELLEAVIRAVRKLAAACVAPGECLRRVARHFIDTWKEAVEVRNTVRNRAMERDRGFCLAPGCSRGADHGHHVDYASHGGSDEETNRASLCIGHHLHGVHGGNLRVHGTAPDGLVFELVERPGTILGPRGPERLADASPGAPSAKSV